MTMNELTLTPIGYIYNDYKEKFGVPRQSGIAEHLLSTIVPVAPYDAAEAYRGLSSYSHLWLLFGFSLNDPKTSKALTVRPPKLGGNERVGVFASRSPYRPNPLGLSVVRLVEIGETEGKVSLIVAGADLVSGTPLYDIKPYLPYADSHPMARGGFSADPAAVRQKVTMDIAFPIDMSQNQREALLESLGQDPRPGYQDDSDRVYGMAYGRWNVQFTKDETGIHVTGFQEKASE